MIESHRNPYARVLAAGLAVGCAGTASAQGNLPLPSGEFQFTGTFEEFQVPNVRGTILEFAVFGADGGDASVTANLSCFNPGGQGATALFNSVVGHGPNSLNPGRPIRFIVGEAGESESDTDTIATAGGAGGGGSGVVYQQPGVSERNGWAVLAAAGGGGGATAGSIYFGICLGPNQSGGDGQTIASGGDGKAFADNTDGGDGGTRGFAGDAANGGGGGGAFGPGPNNPNLDRIGSAAFGLSGDDPVGGQGHADSANGGFGFGGGGGASSSSAGGGGGYSGGGGGGDFAAGGGGGSFTNDAFRFSIGFVSGGSDVGENGLIRYRVTGQTHDSQFTPLELDIDDQGFISTPGLTIGASRSLLPGFDTTAEPDVWYAYTNTSGFAEVFRLTAQPGTRLVGIVNGGAPIVVPLETFTTSLLPGDRIEIRVSTPLTSSGSFLLGGRIAPDTDGDGVPDDMDLCPGDDDTIDTDGDGVPDCADICMGADDRLDSDGDGVPNCLDVCPGADDALDSDVDGIPDCIDVCPGQNDMFDSDGDGVPDCLDICPGEDDLSDGDSDGVPDCIDVCPGGDDNLDGDGDGVPDCADVCPGADDLLDIDGDTVPDCVDVCPGADDVLDSDADGVPDCLDICLGDDDLLDTDGDGVPDCIDVCPGQDDLFDTDGDTVPDCADVCPGEDDRLDSDGDSVPDCADNCPTDPNVVNTDSGMIYATLREAIADASQGDTLQLGACTFSEAGFRLLERDLTIRGGGMGETIIDAQGQPSIFVFERDRSTIENISLVNTLPTGSGGGVANIRSLSSPTFNRVEMTGHDGTGRPSAVMRNSGSGTGVTLNGCWIHSNTVGESGSMLSFLDNTQRTTITNTVFANNAGGAQQGVVRFQGGVDAAIVNSTFAGNGAADAVRTISTTSSISVANTVSDIPLLNENALVAAANNVFPGATGNNIDAVPAFVNPSDGDYTLRPGSPGIDAGDPAAFADAGGGDVDILGNPRIFDNPNVPNAFGSPIDAGAFESQVAGGRCSPADIAAPFGVLDLGDIDAFIASFSAGDPLADITEPFGVLDLDDIDSFITAFTDGCP